MRVLMLTRRVDQSDSRAGFVHRWIATLARHPRIDQLDVICLELGDYDLPANVSVASMGKEKGKNRLREFISFQRAIAPVIRHTDLIFGHMIPRYTLVASPWAFLYNKPMVQWYTHRNVHAELRLVHRMVRRVVTASPESYGIYSNKVRVIGHGIDMSQFSRAGAPGIDEPLIAAVGRLSPIKHLEELLKAVSILSEQPGFGNVRAVIAGGVPDEHEAYAHSLYELVDELGIQNRVEFLGAVPFDEISALYHRAAVTVNLCPTGGADKAVLESMACGVPAVVHNRTFLPLLADDASLLWCEELSPRCTAQRIKDVLALPADERAALGNRLAHRVRADYDLGALIGRLVAVFEETIAEHRGGSR